MINTQIYPDPHAAALAAAEMIVTLAAEAIATRGRFSIGLSGGSTPRVLLALLASDDFAPHLEWPHIHVFWGDERCVPPDHQDSNYRMARTALLDHVSVPLANIHRMRGEIAPAQAASEYEADLRTFFAAEDTPHFDLLLQGMGEDGHTASLFPGTVALRESVRWVAENYVPTLDTWRITLTAPAINAASHVVFLVTGAAKAGVLAEILHGDYQPDMYPAQLIRPVEGELTWLVDEEAAAHI